MFDIQIRGRVICAIAGILLFQSPAVAAEPLRVGGTGATNEMVKSLGVLFEEETGIRVEVIPNLGTGGGNKAVADGVLDLCISGRPLNAAETARGLTAAAEIHTPFVLVTSHRKPSGLKSADIAQIFQAEKPVWDDGTPIRIILRPTNESDILVLGDLFPGMTAALVKARNRPDLTVAATDQDNAEMAEKTVGSLVGATYTQIKSEKRNLRFVSINGVAPSMETYRDGTYPFGKSLYFILAAQKSPLGEQFLAFLHSPKSAAALRDAGVVLEDK